MGCGLFKIASVKKVVKSKGWPTNWCDEKNVNNNNNLVEFCADF